MSKETVEILDAVELRRTLTRLASEIVEDNPDLSQVVLIGIRTRGVPLAHRLAEQIQKLEGKSVAVGVLDITFYRDDLERGMRIPEDSKIPCDLTNQRVVLVDDVIFRGRTIRAALDALNDYGRPQLVRLAVLIDRGHRELPIHPDYVGKNLPTAQSEVVKVHVTEIDQEDRVYLTQR